MLEKFKKEIYDCSRCGFCRAGVDNVCPTYPFSSGFETNYARGRVQMARATLEGKVEITEAFLKDAFECTLCGNCEIHCPIEIPLTEIFLAWRADMAANGYILPAHRQIVENIERYHNPYGPRRVRKSESITTVAKKASILYFPGCTTTRKAPKDAQATITLLGKLKQDFTVLEEDACCGFPLYVIGQIEVAKKAASRTLNLIKEREPDIVLTTCPSCYKAFKKIYPEVFGLTYEFKVMHISEFLPSLVTGKLSELSVKATYQDPCALGRGMGVYDQPREVLHAIPGLDLLEMYSNRENALCCGAGGGVLSTFNELAGQAANERLKQAIDTKANLLVTACPSCYVNFQRMINRAKLNIQVKSLSEVVNEVLK